MMGGHGWGIQSGMISPHSAGLSSSQAPVHTASHSTAVQEGDGAISHGYRLQATETNPE